MWSATQTVSVRLIDLEQWVLANRLTVLEATEYNRPVVQVELEEFAGLGCSGRVESSFVEVANVSGTEEHLVSSRHR